jgi:hypothetical protein
VAWGQRSFLQSVVSASTCFDSGQPFFGQAWLAATVSWSCNDQLLADVSMNAGNVECILSIYRDHIHSLWIKSLVSLHSA